MQSINQPNPGSDNTQFGEAEQQYFFPRFFELNRGFALGAVDIDRFDGAEAEFGMLYSLPCCQVSRTGRGEIGRRRMRNGRLRGLPLRSLLR